MEQESSKFPSVVPRADIPVASSIDEGNFEVRPFAAHQVLSSMLPPADVALAWTRAGAGRDVELRSHPTPGLLIVLEGRAVLIGGMSRTVEAGDVITVPKDHPYGFTAVGPQGLHALHVSFEGGAATSERGASLSSLLARNDERLQTTLNNSFFSLLRGRGVDNEQKRQAMRECLRVFSDGFQTHLFTRQAMCRDPEYAAAFHEHLTEELGHNQLLPDTATSPGANDPVLRAMASWFCHQMVALDNAEKAVVNLVLESGAYYVCTLSQPLFEGHASHGFFSTHAEDDERHKELSVGLLEGLHPQVYARLLQVLDKTWDMVDAMTQRFAYFIELKASSS